MPFFLTVGKIEKTDNTNQASKSEDDRRFACISFGEQSTRTKKNRIHRKINVWRRGEEGGLNLRIYLYDDE